jgi:hypothetical protein
MRVTRPVHHHPRFNSLYSAICFQSFPCILTSHAVSWCYPQCRTKKFCLSKSWKPLICSLKKPPEHGARSTRLQGYQGQYTLAISSQCSLSSPEFFPHPWPIPCLLYISLCYLLLTFTTDPTPHSLSVDFPCGILSLSPCSYIADCFWLVAQSAATCSRWFLARGFFYPRRYRRYLPPKRRLTEDLHSATSQKTTFFLKKIWF